MVRRCDDAGSMAAGKGWSWDVVEAGTDRVVANCDTRKQAREAAADHNKLVALITPGRDGW